ncbi:DUF916 and DUF3324 domain-containing protein [Lactiplantibacillus plantarum]|uniref:DUF916 and DUF3324 domain-containing protein n=1 Tax=Lactiplantibacillus plantarum TaxID=1590 RepID=UPI0013D1AF7E|nr:DUF916 and DUF3324 domain-containing protein [Lactiplantibacillus plantarum]
MKKLMCLFGVIGGLVFMSWTSPSVQATATNAEVQYSVNKISPGQEVDASSPFFDLKAKAGTTRKIQARVYNPTDQSITVKTQLLTTFTNDSGQIAYTQTAKRYDASLKYRFDQIATLAAGSDKVTVPAKSNRVVSATINIPKGFDTGVILGSWYFEKMGQGAKKASKGVNINQKYSYALAVKLTAKEIAQSKLTLGTVTPGLRNYRKVVLATIRNPEPAVVSQLKLTTKVTRKGSSKVLYQNSSDNLIMAPNSNFTYPTFLDDQVMRAGDYTLSVTATTNDSKWAKKTWHWSRDFKITTEQARQNNQKAKNDPAAPISIWWYVLIVIVIAGLSAGIVYLIMKRHNRRT